MALLTVEELQEAINCNNFLRKYQTSCPYCKNPPKYWLAKGRGDEIMSWVIVYCGKAICFTKAGAKSIIKELNTQEVFVLRTLL